MKIYVGQTRAGWLAAELMTLGYGECVNRGELPPRRTPWFFDNGAFADWRADRDFDAWAYNADLLALRAHPTVRPDFIVAPDIVAGGAASLERSRWWLPHIVDIAPVFIVVQDGMDPRAVDELTTGFAGIFVGGTLDWKLETGRHWVRAAHRRSMPCHIGRVGTPERVRWAHAIGADSVDSALPLWSREHLHRFSSAVSQQDGRPSAVERLIAGAAEAQELFDADKLEAHADLLGKGRAG